MEIAYGNRICRRKFRKFRFGGSYGNRIWKSHGNRICRRKFRKFRFGGFFEKKNGEKMCENKMVKLGEKMCEKLRENETKIFAEMLRQIWRKK